MMKSLRLTFNKPTVDHFFAGVGAEGQPAEAVSIKIEDGSVFFLPMAEKSKDTLPLDYRTRGGAEANAEGTQVGRLVRAVQHAIGPFFTLQRVKDGWLKAVPHTKATAPAKFADHVRFWLPKDGAAAPIVAKPGVAAQADGLPAYLGMVRAAFALASSHDDGKKPGRPPREVQEAREIVAEFRRLAILVDVERTDMLRQAAELLGKVIGAETAAPVIHEAEEPAVAAAPATAPKAAAPAPAPAPKVHQLRPAAKAQPAKPQAAAPAPAPQPQTQAVAKAKPRQGEDRGFNHEPVEVSDAQVEAMAARLGARQQQPAKAPRGQVIIRDNFGRPHRRQHA